MSFTSGKYRTRPLRRGLSLAETLVAVAVFTVGVYGLLRLTAVSSAAQKRYENRFRALTLAESQMARFRAAGSRTVLAEAAMTTSTLPLEKNQPSPSDNQLLWRVGVSPVEDEPDLAEVQITVLWKTGELIDPKKPPVIMEKFEMIETIGPAGKENP